MAAPSPSATPLAAPGLASPSPCCTRCSSAKPALGRPRFASAAAWAWPSPWKMPPERDPKLRFVVKWLNDKGDGTELRNIQEGSQDARLFQVPPDYHKFDMQQMMQQRRRPQ